MPLTLDPEIAAALRRWPMIGSHIARRPSTSPTGGGGLQRLLKSPERGSNS